MKKSLILALLVATTAAYAKAPAQPDFSGTYDCKGQDKQEGPYTGVVTLERVAAHSAQGYNAYRFKLEVPDFGAYPGQAVAKGTQMAIHFANTDPKTQDFGTGFADFTKSKAGKWSFRKFYYEPEYKGGNHGTESCTQR
jgi:hypothetical protein